MENVFGRLLSLDFFFPQMEMERKHLQHFFKVTVFFTNFHVKKLPFYQQDQTYRTGVRNRLSFISNEFDEKRSRQPKRMLLVGVSVYSQVSESFLAVASQILSQCQLNREFELLKDSFMIKLWPFCVK